MSDRLMELKSRIRAAARVIKWGRESQYYQDELIGFNFKDLQPTVDAFLQGYRLNILISAISVSGAMGGVATQVEIPLQVFKRNLAHKGWKVRFICVGSAPLAGDNLVDHYVGRLGIDSDLVSCHYNSGTGVPVPVAPNDIFLGSLWYNFLWAVPLIRFQQTQFGGNPRPYVSMVQDYEPGFHPWSSAYMLSTASYDTDWPKRIIFNSSELASFYRARGHNAEDSFIFEPVLNGQLRTALESPSRPHKERVILFYGRPTSRRNCFYLIKKSLEIWAENYENAHAWRVVSVGADYAPFALPKGAKIQVRGKLTLAEYADELHRAAVGFSLMASPHPSYPPLEMAHFGALTVCNNFECKDLSLWHENLLPAPLVDPEHLSQSLMEACRRFEKDPTVGLASKTRKPHYLNDPDPAVLDAIAELIAHGLN
jgi:hypothetical protein